MITTRQLHIKRLFDVALAVLLLPFFILPILILVVISTLDTKQWGLFSQVRVGQHGRLFRIYKIRTLKDVKHPSGHLEHSSTSIGRFLCRSKLNELPQLFNVLMGTMSFVGPRPDLQGFADELEGDDRIILIVKPGITGSATLKYRNEERLLQQQKNPVAYNKTIIWVDKVKINKKYVQNYSFYLDLKLIIKSILNK